MKAAPVLIHQLHQKNSGMVKKIFCLSKLVLVIILFHSCNNSEIYKVGNRVTLDYVIETKMSLSIVRTYLDTIVSLDQYRVPAKWQPFDKLVNIDSIDTKRIYFQSNPEEMYLIQFNGMLLIADVFNENIVKGDWVANRKNISISEEERIKKRFRVEILDKIEAMAKKDGVTDSLLYHKPFDP